VISPPGPLRPEYFAENADLTGLPTRAAICSTPGRTWCQHRVRDARLPQRLRFLLGARRRVRLAHTPRAGRDRRDPPLPGRRFAFNDVSLNEDPTTRASSLPRWFP